MLQAQSTTIVRLYWNPNIEPDVDLYRIWLRRPEDAPEWTQGPLLIHPDTSYTFVNLWADFPDTRIAFSVTAIDTAGNESERSKSVEIFTKETMVDEIPPATPGGLGVEVKTVTQVQFR
jgi:hypothetical protein